MFLARYDSAGRLLWAKRAGGLGIDAGHGAAVDAGTGDVVITGEFSGTVAFGSGEPADTAQGYAGEQVLSSRGGTDVFVARYDGPSGRLRWVHGAGGAGTDRGTSVSLDQTGAAYISGEVAGQVRFGAGEPSPAGGAGQVLIETDIYRHALLAKYARSGRLLWARSAVGRYGQSPPSQGNASGYAVAVDTSSSRAYLVGSLQSSSVIFGLGEPGEFRLGDPLGSDYIQAFVAGYDTSGRALWGRSMGGKDVDFATAAAVGPGGDVGVTGVFRQDAVFGAGEPGEVMLRATPLSGSSYIESDVFVARYRGAGAVSVPDRPVAAAVPGAARLLGASPNPFNPTTALRYDLPEASRVQLTVYNTLGQVVARLVQGEVQSAGVYQVAFDGSGLPSGTYVFRLVADPASGAKTFTSTGRMLLVK